MSLFPLRSSGLIIASLLPLAGLFFSTAALASPTDGNLPAGIRSPLTKPTLAAPLQRLIQPWEPHRALVVALTPSFISNQPEALQTYLELFRIAAPYLDILVVVPYDHPEVQVRVTLLLSQTPGDEAVRKRVRFVPATNATVWARDYLPQYALGAKGRLIMLDSGRVDFTADPSEALIFFTAPDPNPTANYYRQLQRNLADDVTPAYLSSYVRSKFGFEVQLVRPPISLDGGDFISLGGDDLILSQSTLRFNGGEEDNISQVIGEYFGLKNIHYLTTLPGYTIDHLDFILMPADESTILIAEPPPRIKSPQLYDSILVDQVTEVLVENRQYLEKHFPHKKLIGVPMPPIARTPRTEVLARIRQQVVQELCTRFLVNWSDVAGRPVGDPIQKEAQKLFEQSLVAQFGQVGFDDDKDLDRVARVVMGETLNALETKYVKQGVAYRTYLNATFINTAEGKRAVIIPRYKPRSTEEVKILEKMETQVLAAYRQAFPGAELHWLYCDSLISSFGAVHCITHTIPDWNAIKAKN